MGFARRRRSGRMGAQAGRSARHLVESLERRVLLSRVFWIGKGSTPSWSDPHNWSTGALPGPADDAVIATAAATTITFDTASTAQPAQTVNSLTTNQPIDFISGTFTATNGVQTSANLILAGATLLKTSFGGSASLYMSTGTLNADTLNLATYDSVDTTGQKAPVAVDGGLTLNAVLNVGYPVIGAEFVDNSGTLNFFGTQSISGKGQIVLQQLNGSKAQIFIHATILFIFPVLRFIPATLTLAPGMILRGAGTISDSPNGYGTLVNQGTILADSQGQTLQISPENFNDQGTAAQTNGGILSILAGADGKGALTFSRNAVVNNIASIGTLTISAGDVSINSTTPVTVGTLNLSGGILDGTAEIDLTGANSTWTGGTMAGTGPLVVEPVAVLTVTASPSVSASRPFDNNGTVNINAGALELDGLGLHSGAFAIAAGATLVFGGKSPQNFTPTSSLTGSGAVVFQSGGGAAIRGTYNLFSTALNPGAFIEFLGPLAVTRFLTVAAGSKVYVGPPQLGAVPAAAATPAITPDPILQVITENVIAGTMEVVPFCTLEEDGVLLFTGAAGPAVLLDSDITTPGTLKLQNGATVQFAIGSGNATINSQGIAALPGQVSVQGGTATFSVNTGLRMIVSAPISGGAIDQEQGTGTLQVSGKQALTAVTVGDGTLDVDACPSLGANVPIIFAGGTLQVRDQPSLTVGSLMASIAGNSISLDLGNATLTAALGLSTASTLFVSGTGPAAKLVVGGSIALQQPAAIHDDTADVEFATPLTLTGPAPLSGYALAKVGAGTLTLDGGITNTPAGLVEVDGGTLLLNKLGGAALDADVLINGPTAGASVVRLAQDNQIGAGHGVTLDATTGPALLDLNGHSQTLASVAIAQAGAMPPPNPQNDQLSIGSGHLTLAMAAGKTASIGTLSVGLGGRIDLAKGSLQVLYGSPLLDPVAAIRAYLGSGAMFSSAADSAHALGFADSADHIVGGMAANSLLIKYTPIGDVDLDGHVDFNDLVILARHYGLHNANWDQGDVTYDGNVSFADLVALARNYGK